MTDRQILMLHLGEILADMFRDCLNLPKEEYQDRRKWWGNPRAVSEDGQVWKCEYWDRVESCLERLAKEPMDEPVEMGEIAWYLRGLCPKLFNEDGTRTEMTFAEACSNA